MVSVKRRVVFLYLQIRMWYRPQTVPVASLFNPNLIIKWQASHPAPNRRLLEGFPSTRHLMAYFRVYGFWAQG